MTKKLYVSYDFADQTSLQVAGRILRDSTLFYSCLHRTDGAKNNRICQFAFDGEVGVAEVDFFIVTSEPLAMLKTYELSSTTLMDTIRSSRLHSENTNLLSKYVFYVEKNVVTQKVVPLSALVNKAVYIKEIQILLVYFQIYMNTISDIIFVYILYILISVHTRSIVNSHQDTNVSDS